MKIRAQIGMVLNLDKCIGCHTCSVTCKNVWTNRPGTEYIWFNNVETKPGVGYPKSWEDQQNCTTASCGCVAAQSSACSPAFLPTQNCRRLTTTTSLLPLIIRTFRKHPA